MFFDSFEPFFSVSSTRKRRPRQRDFNTTYTFQYPLYEAAKNTSESYKDGLYTLTVDVPGISKENAKVSLDITNLNLNISLSYTNEEPISLVYSLPEINFDKETVKVKCLNGQIIFTAKTSKEEHTCLDLTIE